MRGIIIGILLVSSLSLGVEANAERKMGLKRAKQASSLASKCSRARGIVSGEIWKSDASNHFSPGDPRNGSTSFIFARGNPRPRGSCLNVYDSKGNLVHKLGEYRPSGSDWAARYYGGWGCGDKKNPGSIASLAKGNTKKTTVYVKVSDKTCIRVDNPSECYNSSSC